LVNTFLSLASKFSEMQETILISLPLQQLQNLIIDCVNTCLDTRTIPITKCEIDEFLTVSDTAQFLKLTTSTVYGLISKGTIPCMKQGKRVYFSKIELINYLKQGKKKTISEIKAETDTYLSNKKAR
jgi:excisionase family DNA binding protein